MRNAGIQKTFPQSTPRVCGQSIDGPRAKRGKQLLHTGKGRQIGLDRNDRRTERLNLPGRPLDSSAAMIKSMPFLAHCTGQFIAYAG
jgi:hypothetical protein